MSTAIAMAPSPAPHDRPSFPSDLAPASSAQHGASSPAQQRTLVPTGTPNATAHRSGSGSPRGAAQAPKSSPPSAARHASGAPKIVVKKEPNSPDLPTTRHRPRKLDLSNKGAHPGSNTPGTARPMTARDNLGIQEVGLACLSPGFVTQDPIMKEQLQRSMSVRDQQRMIIEQRMQQQSAKGDGPDTSGKDPVSQFAAKTPGLSRRNKAQLSILPPSAESFANERVIQSAPLGHSFTGRQHPAPLSRHITNQPNTLSNTSHIHHVPANQTNNRLPPISDVFGQVSGHPDNAPTSLYPQTSRPPMASPGHPPQMQHGPPTSGRAREYKSAEEAQHEIAGGRPELLPKIVHYGNAHQPPTPPSPAPGSRAADPSRSASRRRTRAEYEDGSPPLGHGPAPQRRGPFGAGRDSPESQRQKREEFMQLCARAWDLFHS
ncbi:hypothetical protein HER10_EVM0009255 [Colletotrichum scovillei]|uniref:Pathogenicity factor n=1 Tax=Colletotrichum scovillei TaxID=1209932 RepID=A0A9P7R8T6_9PEZI|nr:uncharacterized protein HER10_EVM0009255 [Colletotrichum scovillei]KAF4783368.1 hypothetical protein HER10_EVM0009255 [Colletotrichum scovillei]KAG7051750.1 hypothetical protein JMJ77_0002366 [Colletotrichum scovillei]KAG7070786.1 hypothetical protein JMJ76_0002031 [Colletotrichum scovillei]KAG7079083.1 hypothetical protein JMJ78_0002744 [Colletotrichum scovillei]